MCTTYRLKMFENFEDIVYTLNYLENTYLMYEDTVPPLCICSQSSHISKYIRKSYHICRVCCVFLGNKNCCVCCVCVFVLFPLFSFLLFSNVEKWNNSVKLFSFSARKAKCLEIIFKWERREKGKILLFGGRTIGCLNNGG